MEILFCDECGMRFTGETTPAPVAAQPGNEQRKLCEACRAKQSGSRPSHRQLQPATRARSERVLPGAQQAAGAHRSATHPAESARYRGGQASGGGAAIIGVAVVVALLTIVTPQTAGSIEPGMVITIVAPLVTTPFQLMVGEVFVTTLPDDAVIASRFGRNSGGRTSVIVALVADSAPLLTMRIV